METVSLRGEASSANYSVLAIELPGSELTPIGILMEELQPARLHLRLRRDWQRFAGEDADVLETLADDLARKAASGDLGVAGLFRHLEESLGNVLRITTRQPIQVEDFDLAMNRLYREHVQSNVVEFRTHLPLYSLRAAAGRFLDNSEVSEEGWVEAPENLRLAKGMFVARIEGHSMEPKIPHGSLCVFREHGGGSRRNLLVLVEDREATGLNRYAVKRYHSEWTGASTGDFSADFEGDHSAPRGQSRIRLISLNPAYPSWDLDPDESKYSIVAEFVRVLE